MARHAKQGPGQQYTLFVYGTLKRNFSNHYFLRQATYVGQARTVEHYGLYVDEFPFVYASDPVCAIRGEVYRVDSATLTRLDGLEGHPRRYRREEIEVRLDSGEEMRAWLYFFPERSGRLIPSGEFNPLKEFGRES